uniref:Ufm1-specific protease 2 n=1 Tax=Denticeps clupeoides TaxID=299321 RepID=A0AAY4A110_9TELE
MVLVDDGAMILRLGGGLEFLCQLDVSDASQRQLEVSRSFADLRSRVKAESLVFSLTDSALFIWPNKSFQASLDDVDESTACGELLQSEDDDGGGKKKKKDKKSPVVNLRFMMEITEPTEPSAPCLYRENKKHHCIRMVLPMDCVVTVRSDETFGSSCKRLLRALSTQLSEMEAVTLRHMKDTDVPVPRPFHFSLPTSTELVTIVYPASVDDKGLESFRKELHNRFELPDDRPYFRRSNAFHFPDEPYKDGYLRNPHNHLNHPNIEGAKPYLVQGVYSYHHYMQDRMDDNGWGCAYRSLQTICSWFRQQGYMERTVPTHKEIQQALVDVGDKPAAFVGSRQWIGSIEVQAVLSHLLGVTSKILFVSQGSELPSQGRELANHFLTEGTPVMIGGGVLAHTILGVAWSETSGQIRFLILDPHYTGGEDLQTITDKGWCGWKGPEFWDQNAYYNLCLPQRPKAI